jgi:hypothetical protein
MDPLEPLVIDTVGRGGSTAVMSLLRSSDEVVVEGPYPFERRYYGYLRTWAAALDGERWSTELWGQKALASAASPDRQPGLVGPPPWFPRAYLEAADGEPTMGERCFELAWAEFSRRARAAEGAGRRVRLHAEKLADTWAVGLDSLAPARVAVLLRDPRDTFASIDAFNAKRGRLGFGRERHTAEHEYLDFFVSRHRERMRWILALPGSEAVPVLRYEELVTEPQRFAGRLERWLGIELDIGSLTDAEELSAHATAAEPAGSIGRWRRELDHGVADRLSEALGPELDALGYPS